MIKLFLVLLFLALPASLLGFGLQVELQWLDEPVRLPVDELPLPGGEVLSISRLDFLLSQPELTLVSGRSVSLSDWHSYVHGALLPTLAIPTDFEESISSLTLHLGPSEAVNHSEANRYPPTHALNPLHNGLHWDPQGGYIFLALEGRLAGTETAFAYHYGNSPNRLELVFDGPLDPKGDYQLTLHLDRLFPSTFQIGDETSTHSRPGDPVLAHFRRVLPQAFTLTRAKISPTDPIPEAPVADEVGTPYPFKMPRHFPRPNLPNDYPLTKERIRLGRELFFETALSKNTATSCASCHPAQTAFADNTPRSFGFLGEKTKRHSMPLMNLAWKSTPFFWDGREKNLRDQILKPIEDPLEMGESLPDVLAKLEQISYYPRLFQGAFGDPRITEERLAIAIEQFILSLTSFGSKFDRAAQGRSELTEQEKQGFELFMTENDPRLGLRGADCFHCHSGALFTNHRFHNNGLLPANGDLGQEHATGLVTDRFKFSTPSLRNVGVTAPYMHDGRFETLEEVVAHYSEGIHRSPTLDANIAKHPGAGLNLDPEEQAALVAFLKTLSDSKFAN